MRRIVISGASSSYPQYSLKVPLAVHPAAWQTPFVTETAARLKTHCALAAELAALTDEDLMGRLASADSLHAGIGGTSARLSVKGVPIFAKRVPLTETDQRFSRSTANHAKLPMFCQYGMGGCPGFGAWRELAAQERATGWVSAGECEHFPLLHHWRVFPRMPPRSMSPKELNELEQNVRFWDNSEAVRRRILAVHDAPAELVLFCEYVPQNLLKWLSDRLSGSAQETAEAIAFVERTLWPTIDFMNARGLRHFDTHFENIQTDGNRLYVGDLGLALDEGFELTAEERAFIDKHQSYDCGRAAVGYMHAIVARLAGEENWDEKLRRCLESGMASLVPTAAQAVRRFGPGTIAFLEFARKLREETKHAIYPDDEIGRLLNPGR
jgi:hypothetical protein